MNIFTFWEGEMPEYIKLCMETWRFPYIVLNYENVGNYTDLKISPQLKRFTMPQIADCVRVHVLRDQGGYWLDADTIMINEDLPTTNMIGNPNTRTNTIGYLYAQKSELDMFVEWAAYQDDIIDNPQITPALWSLMGNSFTDNYVKSNNSISICSVENCWPEVYMIDRDIPRYEKYLKFYFETSHQLNDIKPTNMLMLHNSWTPNWYKKLSCDKVLSYDCTMSNILRTVLNDYKHYLC